MADRGITNGSDVGQKCNKDLRSEGEIKKLLLDKLRALIHDIEAVADHRPSNDTSSQEKHTPRRVMVADFIDPFEKPSPDLLTAAMSWGAKADDTTQSSKMISTLQNKIDVLHRVDVETQKRVTEWEVQARHMEHLRDFWRAEWEVANKARDRLERELEHFKGVQRREEYLAKEVEILEKQLGKYRMIEDVVHGDRDKQRNGWGEGAWGDNEGDSELGVEDTVVFDLIHIMTPFSFFPTLGICVSANFGF
ncbi:hypothetical protein EJ04DRAFT_558277 [Polyplosphaeria fusca]|uniref:Uncharacterized protein n=1 Tax=Polyplosphaeria fusca TaxID=682080 RepID=A0A9P4RD19_9PLEO|nr:hypothetical protein EJ04DRAFT_558277 [Polyplosphaeria fusca]